MTDCHDQGIYRRLRPGDLIGLRQQATGQVYGVIKVEQHQLLVMPLSKPSLKFVAFKDVLPPF